MLLDVFGMAKLNQIATYGSRYNVTFWRTGENAVLNRAGGVAIDRVLISAIILYVP